MRRAMVGAIGHMHLRHDTVDSGSREDALR
jgi:hypothetical protein